MKKPTLKITFASAEDLNNAVKMIEYAQQWRKENGNGTPLQGFRASILSCALSKATINPK